MKLMIGAENFPIIGVFALKIAKNILIPLMKKKMRMNICHWKKPKLWQDWLVPFLLIS